MELIRIGGNTNRDKIKDMLDKCFFNSKVRIEEKNYEKRFDFLFYLGKLRSSDEIALYDSLAKLIQDIIVNIYIKDVIKERVIKICGEYTPKEKEEISGIAHEILKDKSYYMNERDMINKDIVNYLIESNSILVDGYMRFRLKEYLYLVDISIEKAIFELESEKEYKEFLGMLQYFVNMQESELELVNVIIKDNDYFLIDMDDNILENGLLDDIDELYYDEVSKADLLVSSLIVIAPKELVIHIEENKEDELISIITEVFGDRIRICRGCEKCKLNKNNKKNKESWFIQLFLFVLLEKDDLSDIIIRNITYGGYYE